MFAHLLGMGRKKEKEKDEEQQERVAAVANGALPPAGNIATATTAGVGKAAVMGQTQSAAHSLVPQSPPLSTPTSLSAKPNGCFGTGGTTTTATATSTAAATGGCQEGSSREAAAAAAATGVAATAGAAGQEGGGALAAGGRSLAPSPPVGPAAFASPAVTSAAGHQPLGQKAFHSEAAAVERGLHIQLGDTGAKTESQLGGQQLEAAKRLRHLLGTNRERMVQEMLSRGWVPLLLRWLGLVHRPSLQVEALSALTTVAQTTTEHTPLLLKHGGVGTLVSLLKSPSLEMVEQAMWVLGKLAQDGQDGTTARDSVLQAGVLGPLVRCLEQHPTLLSLQRIGAWSLFNLLDGQPRPTVDVATVNTVMPAINRLLMAGDSEVLCHACSALSHLCDGSAAHIKVVVESGVCKRLVQLLDHPSSQVVKPALRTIGNVVCAEDDADYTEAILEAGSVASLKKLIAHPNREIQKEACWTLSNIAAGSVSQIQSVLDSGAMPQLIKLATAADTESEVRSEAFWVVLNAASCGSDAQIEYLVSQGCVQILSDLLGESSMVMMALEGIERVLSVGDLRVVRNAIATHSHGDQDVFDDEEGGHCMECASLAAVGAAAAAASDGRIGGEGDSLAGGESCAYTNPYACMLTPEKIQALETHKNSAVAKRANRVWARYFVTCAICRGSFSRHGSSATFCPECNCHVCGSCDCTVFHLAYQDKLWEEMEGKEKRGKKAQQAAKKNKKAKKREKKKNAAKELAVEPPSTEAKADVVAPGGVKRVNKTGKDTDTEKDNAGDQPDSVQRSPGRGTGHHRSDSPNKASSSASTESNSEDEYNLSSPQGAHHDSTTVPSTSTAAAAAIINATAIAVNSATTSKKNGATRTTATTTATPPKKPAVRGQPAVVASTTPSLLSKLVEDERGQRRTGKKQGRRDQQQQQQQQQQLPPAPGQDAESLSSSSSTSSPSSRVTATASRGKGSPSATATVPDDDDEEPWVVVGGAGGKRAGTAKWNKGQQHRMMPPAPVGAGVSGAGGTSSIVWASESSPANVAVRAAPPARSSAAASPPPAVAAGATARVSPSFFPAVPPAHVQVVSPSGGAAGGAWGAAGAVKPAAPLASAAVGAPGSTANGVESAAIGTNGSHPAPQRPRQVPGPGAFWGAHASVVEARSTPSLVAAAAPPGVTAVSPPGASLVGLPTSRVLGPSNRAGVIGPRPQAATMVAKPVEPSSFSVPTANALSSVSAAVGNRVATPTASSFNKGGAGVVAAVRGGGGGLSSGASLPLQKATIGSGNSSNSSGNGLARTVSTGSEALVENEKLVSFLLETGSILALAQRLEEEEEWRRAMPSPINSRPA